MEKVKTWWWEDDTTIICEMEDGSTIRCNGCYWSNLSYDGLKYDNSDVVEIELNIRYSNTPCEKVNHDI